MPSVSSCSWPTACSATPAAASTSSENIDRSKPVRDLNELNAWRITDPKALSRFGGWAGDGTCGAFLVVKYGQKFLCIASAGGGWDHLSVSLAHRTPTWEEMDRLKRMFFRDDETAMQFHVPP